MKKDPKKKALSKSKTKSIREVTDYDTLESSSFIDASKPLKFEDLGLKLPDRPE